STTISFEVIVVDDGRRSLEPLASALELSVIRAEGKGPAAARNRGIERAAGDVILFTDDDTEPEPNWVHRAYRALQTNPAWIAVGGVTVSRPFDPLYEHSIEEDGPAAWTCNVAYRREAIRQVGGFDERFPSAHAEDLDLAYRASALGEIGFAADM